MGWARIPMSEIRSWMDYYTEGRLTGEVAKEGFDLTLVETKNLGKFECCWERKEFEQKLNEFYDKAKEFPII